MSDTRKTMHCGHCLRTTTFELRGEYIHRGIKYVSDVKAWYMWECLGCLHPTLVEHYYAVSVDEIIFDEKLDILYPTDKTPLTNLPETINKRYLAVLKVQNIEPSGSHWARSSRSSNTPGVAYGASGSRKGVK